MSLLLESHIWQKKIRSSSSQAGRQAGIEKFDIGGKNWWHKLLWNLSIEKSEKKQFVKKTMKEIYGRQTDISSHFIHLFSWRYFVRKRFVHWFDFFGHLFWRSFSHILSKNDDDEKVFLNTAAIEGAVVDILAFNSDGQSSNSTRVYFSSSTHLYEKDENIPFLIGSELVIIDSNRAFTI